MGIRKFIYKSWIYENNCSIVVQKINPQSNYNTITINLDGVHENNTAAIQVIAHITDWVITEYVCYNGINISEEKNKNKEEEKEEKREEEEEKNENKIKGKTDNVSSSSNTLN